MSNNISELLELNSSLMKEAIFQGLSKSVMITVTDSKGNIVFCNPKFCEITGYSKDNIIGQNHRIFNSGFHPKSFFDSMWKTILAGEVWNGEIKNKDNRGRFFWVNSTISSFQLQGPEKVFVNIAVEITDQKMSDELYLESANILSEISRSSPVCFYQYESTPDGSLKFNFISDSVEAIFRISKEEIYKDITLLFSRIHPDDIGWLKRETSEAVKSLTPWSGDYRLKFSDNDIVWIQAFAVAQKHTNGSILLHGTMSDITARKNLESELIDRAKLALLGEMASGIAHEINNPLTVIMAKTESIKKHLKAEPVVKDVIEADLNKVSQMSQRVAKIIRGLKTISRDGSQDPFEKSSLTSIVKDTLSLAVDRFRSAGVKLIEGTQIEAEIECRPTQVSQVILNLLNNACDAVENLPEKWVKIDTELTAPKNVRVVVTDSGPGIPAEIAEKLMEPFFTTKSNGKGTGLGLSISTGIATDHGGSLILDRGSKNTRFILELPAKSAAGGFGSLVLK